MALIDRINSGLAELRHRDTALSINDWAEYFTFGGNTYGVVQTTMGQVDQEQIAHTSVAGFKGSGPIFSLVLARLQVFSQVRFQWTRFKGSQPTDLFGSPELDVLERPWRGGTTSDLLARMEVHASCAGCAYVIRPRRDQLSLLRPDRVIIVMGSQTDADDPSEAPDAEIIGFIHTTSRGRMTMFGPDEVAYYAPIPDPDYRFLGMSWITPVIRDLQADSLATEHKARFFVNSAPQPLHARILTPAGWSTMGEMQSGAQVIGSDGKPHTVVGVYPQGERDIYRVTFSSGAQVECTEDHLWSVASIYDRKRGMTRTMTLAQIMREGVTYPSGPAKWSVPLVSPVEFEPGEPLTVDPYLLGSLLGDGYLCGNVKGSGAASLACHTGDVDDQTRIIGPLLPDGMRIVRRDRGGNASELSLASAPGPGANPLTEQLRDLGVWGLRGHEKHIPERYLRASVTDRVALLQGLIDTDGSVNKRQPNTVTFDSTSEALCRGVAELVGGLGGVATVRQSRTGSDHARPQWHVSICRLPEWISPCRLARKASRYRPTLRGGAYRYIRGVELVGREQAQCIAVDSDDHLYVTDDFVLTHNTPNLAIKFDASITIEKVKQFKALLEAEHKGAFNAWKTLYLGGGADPVTVGNSFKDMDYAVIQGRAESRLASAAGVPPSWVGFAEGLSGSSLNSGNFKAAHRRYGDGTMTHLWTSAATSLEVLLDRPKSRPGEPPATLWYDGRIPFMREDAGDLAKIQSDQAQTIVALVRDGFTPESSVQAVINNDFSLLVHSGKVSVQLQEPGAAPPGPTPEGVPAGV